MAALETGEGLVEGEGIEGLNEAQALAAESAKTVDGFVDGFHDRAEELVKNGTVSQSTVDERAGHIEAAAEGNGDLKLQKMGPNTLGRAHIDGGRQSIELATAMAAAIRSAKDVKQMHHAAAHEGDHAKTKALKGELRLDNKTIGQKEYDKLYEGKAEETGNMETGAPVETHREGQPDELYREGQDLFAHVASRVKGGRAKVRRVMETTGDLTELQGALAA